MFGNATIRYWVDRSLAAGALVWIAMPLIYPQLGWAGAVAGVVAGYFWFRMREVSAEAGTNAFAAQKVFKLMLHRAIWWSSTIFGVALGVLGFLG